MWNMNSSTGTKLEEYGKLADHIRDCCEELGVLLAAAKLLNLEVSIAVKEKDISPVGHFFDATDLTFTPTIIFKEEL